MNIIFFGTGKFSETILRGLIEMGETILAVVSQPDKVNGRNGKVNFSEIKNACIELSIPLYQFNSVSNEGEEVLKSYSPDLFVTASYGQIIKQNILDIPKFGTINVHASLLPKYRGSSPIQWAILNGEKKTGITIMQTVLQVDTGDMFLQREIEIEDDDTTSSVLNKLSTLGVECLREFFANYDYYISHKTKQDESKMTYYPMIKKEDYKLDFNAPSEKIHNKVRALENCYFEFGGARFKVLKTKILNFENEAKVSSTNNQLVANLKNSNSKIKQKQTVQNLSNRPHKAGEVLAADSKKGLVVATADGAIEILTIQPAGKQKMEAKAYMNSNKFKLGDVIG